MRKSVPVVVSFVVGLIVGAAGLTYAADSLVNVVVNGKAIETKGTIVDGKTFLPVRAVADALNLDVAWDGDTRTVTLTSKSTAPTSSVYKDQYVSVSNVTVKNDMFNMTDVMLEVTNVNPKTVTGFLSVTFYDAKGGILGRASGAVTDLAPGATKTVTLMATQDFSGAASYKVQSDAMITK